MTGARATATTGTRVDAVIAVKALDAAKTRLAADFPPAERARLVLAMLEDTLRATRGVPAVRSITVVTPDAAVAELAARGLAAVAADPGAGLNAALRAGAAQVRRRYGPSEIVALQADLPALRPAELAAALAAAPPRRRALVADELGSGTSMLVQRDPQSDLDPRFGADSARLHREAGAVPLHGHWPGLRRDVDTAADLRQALILGVGPATCGFLADVGRLPADMCHP